jgi:hypothetical protein
MMMMVVKVWRFREESVNFYTFAKRTRSSIGMCDIKKHSSSDGKKNRFNVEFTQLLFLNIRWIFLSRDGNSHFFRARVREKNFCLFLPRRRPLRQRESRAREKGRREKKTIPTAVSPRRAGKGYYIFSVMTLFIRSADNRGMHARSSLCVCVCG